MDFGDHQAMSMMDRTDVEDRKGVVVFVEDLGGGTPGEDFTKNTRVVSKVHGTGSSLGCVRHVHKIRKKPIWKKI